MLIYKYSSMSKEESNEYKKRIRDLADNIADGYIKGKKVLIITGSGISHKLVPDMEEIMKKIVELINDYSPSWKKSPVFNRIFFEYNHAVEYEKHQMQAQLLTYIQNAYMGKEKYVQKDDLLPLADIWNQFVQWLLIGDEKYKGVIDAEPSGNHLLISSMYKEMNAISITTNFDNLLYKAFDNNPDLSSKNFYPILDKQTFDKYFVSEIDDDSYVEIQSRGDAFWVECTGSKNKTCINKHKQCYVPGKNIDKGNGEIKCNLCGSDAKIYFAFPGTKEKDSEMAEVMDGVWKYFANTISTIVIIGNSMDYDPVLVEFMREITRKRKVSVLYISRYKGSRNQIDIREKEATKMLFRDESDLLNVWARAEQTEAVLRDLLDDFTNVKSEYMVDEFTEEEREDARNFFEKNVLDIFGSKDDFDNLRTNLKVSKLFYNNILNEDKVDRLQHFSQLGLKTYWLRGNDKKYQQHTRFKHSMGVMLIASYLYFEICRRPNRQELTFLQTAAMLHDVGHLPFSHLLEEVFDEFGWITAGESTAFNHEQHTKRLINDMVEEGDIIKKLLEEIHYTKSELQQLINGEYGKGYLDALVNSPIDCDKIEYLFSDAIFMDRGTKEDFQSFMKEYVEDLSVNGENFLLLQKSSTGSFLKLIRMRGEMYDQVYLRRGLRFLEACCKLILRIFIAYECAEQETFTSIENSEHFKEFYNLSEVKIEQIKKYMEECLTDLKKEEVCELHVLEHMTDEINKNNVISSTMKETVLKCFDMIKNTTGDKAIKEIEKERIVTFEVINNKVNRTVLKDMLKNVYLRFPGIVLVDYVESKSSFSFGKRENRRRRSDGTKSATENILIKDIKQLKGHADGEFKCLGDTAVEVNNELHYPNHSYIYIYRISDDSFCYMQAEDYIIHELRKEGIIDGN